MYTIIFVLVVAVVILRIRDNQNIKQKEDHVNTNSSSAHYKSGYEKLLAAKKKYPDNPQVNFASTPTMMAGLLAYYAFVHNSDAKAADMDGALHQMNMADSAEMQMHMDNMLADQDFLNKLHYDQQFAQDIEMNISEHTFDITEINHTELMDTTAMDEAMKMVTPFEHGGYDMHWGNSFNEPSFTGEDNHHDFDDFNDHHDDFNDHHDDFHDHNDFGGHDFGGHNHF
ncbi:hypothetical protein GGQ84_002325 [Desulfitispora alkaliphila]|uniref:hypothetical protein n=1 Tax=Desulfitispora alkaliphila TaxID=622674 RepID=UPI003D1958AC